ncbi:MAG: rod shape-determining protein MreC [Thiotrichales bacterium]|nr:MAG: rod shape-determining protein MreC [Thiotrichales bacterium]
MQTLFLRGPSATLRMVILVLLSLAVMTVDHRWKHLDAVRNTLSYLLYPVEYLVDLPIRLYYWGEENLSSQRDLISENQQLKDMQLQNRVQLQKLDILEKENERLRKLLSATPKTTEDHLIAEIVAVDVDPYRHFIVLNKGSSDGVYKGQPIIDAHGVMAQVVYVNALSSTAMLISDVSHAIPVQIDRTGLRSVAFGTGQTDHLDLKHIPHNADIRVGDKLISSGLGGRFPRHYPVAMITKIDRNTGETFIEVRAEPLAQLDTSREVLLVWTHGHEKPMPGLEEPVDQTDEQSGETDADTGAADTDADAGEAVKETAEEVTEEATGEAVDDSE